MKKINISKEEITNLVEYLNEHTGYYNEGCPRISDKEWDECYFTLVKYEKATGFVHPDSPTQKIEYQTVDNLKKVEHNHPMLSLDKTKDWNAFLRYFIDIDPFKDVVGMLKLDGLTCSLRYVDGYLVSAETRGNGEVGEDVTHNILNCKGVPRRIDYKEELILDGEIICDKKTFEDKFSKDYKNPRNFAAGSIRLLSAKENKGRELTFVVWNVIKGFDEENSLIKRFNKIASLGFLVTPWTSSFDWDAKEFLIEQAEKEGYPIDGLVGRFNDIEFGNSLGRTSHHARAAYAFKMYDEEAETELLNIEWTMGRTGVLTPVAVFKPVELEGSMVERASLHNISVMEQLLSTPFYKQELKIIKANQIIPQIIWAGDGEGTHFCIPKVCPVCGEPTEIKNNNGVKTLYCSNPSCSGKLINRIDHFCGKKGLDIKGLSKATLEKLIDWGWVSTTLDIYSLENYKKLWYNKVGFGVKSVDKILEAIEASKNCELSSFISALGIPLIGTTVAKDICKFEYDWHNFRECVEGKFNFSKWDGFGDEMTLALWNFDYAEADKIANLLNLKNSLYGESNTSKNLDGKIICITGKLNIFKNRDALKTEIEKAGGKVTGSVSRKTNFLITNEDSNTTKAKSAREYGVEVISEATFLEKYLT